MRRFEVVSAYREAGVGLPRRSTPGSAGYDLAAAEDVVITPGEVALVPTGLKVYLSPGEFLAVFIRSSLAVARGLGLANGVAVIDADYADNPANEGHILLAVHNRGREAVTIRRGERVAQGVFLPFALVDGDRPGPPRHGGLGSTGHL